jgi:hypothetical protein
MNASVTASIRIIRFAMAPLDWSNSADEVIDVCASSMWRSERVFTIGQEPHASLGLAREPPVRLRCDDDLRLLADAELVPRDRRRTVDRGDDLVDN